MKIILSPSKLQTISNPIIHYKPLFRQEKTEKLRNKLRRMSIHSIQSHFKLSNEKSKALYTMYRQQEDAVYAPFELYSGIAFREIMPTFFDDIQHAYLNRHGVILSALYGVIEPTMGIQPYRLDFTKKLDALNLYDYWSKDILDYFSNQDIVVNLASSEFSKLLIGYTGKFLTIHFKDEKDDGTLKIIATNAKKMRGMMFNYMCEHCIQDIEQLKIFDENGYVFCEQLSDETNFVYVKSYV